MEHREASGGAPQTVWRSIIRKLRNALPRALREAPAPGETLALYAVMGKVLEQIEDLNRAGKIASDGDAATRGKFNKDILLRARKAQVKKAEDAPKAGDTTPPT